MIFFCIFKISLIKFLGINPNPCAVFNGQCSHFCLLIPGAPWRSCACPVGVKLLEDGLQCASDTPLNILLVGARNGIYYFSLDTKEFIRQQIPIAENIEEYKSTNAQMSFADVSFDPLERKIYWINRGKSTIGRCRLNGSNYEVINLIFFIKSLSLNF